MNIITTCFYQSLQSLQWRDALGIYWNIHSMRLASFSSAKKLISILLSLSFRKTKNEIEKNTFHLSQFRRLTRIYMGFRNYFFIV